MGYGGETKKTKVSEVREARMHHRKALPRKQYTNAPHHSRPLSPRNPADSVAITLTNFKLMYAKISTS